MRGRRARPRSQNVYVTRRTMRRVSNAPQLERFLSQHDFTAYALEDLSFDQQVDLFSQANLVVAPHGAGLANILFCQPGAKVLELSPDAEFRPFFAYMANKLGLTHGILPCPTSDNTFQGDMTVDIAKFAGLFRMLRHHLS